MAFPTLTVLAALNGTSAESPISEGGKWAKPSWCVNAGEIHGSSDGYTSATSAPELNGSYWTPQEYEFPFVAIQMLFPENIGAEWFGVWCCLNVSSHNGYFLKIESVGTAAKFNFKLQIVTAGTPTTLKEVKEKVVTAKDWAGIFLNNKKELFAGYKVGEAGAWEEIAGTTDSTYKKGFTGIETNSKSSDFGEVQFSVGAEPAESAPKYEAQKPAPLPPTFDSPKTLRDVYPPPGLAYPPQEGVLDTWQRSEAKLKNNQWWQPLSWVAFASGYTGSVSASGWSPLSFSSVSGAYWAGKRFREPTVSVTQTAKSGVERYFRIWACIPYANAPEESGYALLFTETGGEGFTVDLEKWVSGVKTSWGGPAIVKTVSGAQFYLAVSAGVVSAWYKEAGAETSTFLIQESDATYTEGYAGIEGSGSAIQLTNFSVTPNQIRSVSMSGSLRFQWPPNEITEAGQSGETGYAKSGTSFKLKAPAGAQNGDILLVRLGVAAGGVTFTPPAGWELIGSSQLLEAGVADITEAWYWLRYSGTSEWEWKWSVGAEYSILCVGYRGCVVTGNPIGAKRITEGELLGTGVAMSPGLTTIYNGAKVVMVASNDQGNFWTIKAGGEFATRSNTIDELWADWTPAAGAGPTGAIELEMGVHAHSGYAILLLSLIPAGATTPLTALLQRSFSGALSFVGSMTRKWFEPLSGGLSFAGLVERAPAILQRPLNGALSFVGSIGKTGVRNLPPAGLGFTGSYTRGGKRSMSGSLSFKGGITAKITRLLKGELSFTGVFTFPRYVIDLVASLGFSGSISEKIKRPLSGGLSFKGTLAPPKLLINLNAALSFVGKLSRKGIAPLSGALSFTGSAGRRVVRRESSELKFTGSTSRRSIRGLRGTLGFSGGIGRRLTKVLSGGLSFTGRLSKAKSMFAGLTFSGSVKPKLARPLSGALSFVGSLTKKQKIAVLLESVLSFKGTTNKRMSRELPGSVLSFTGSILRELLARISLVLQREPEEIVVIEKPTQEEPPIQLDEPDDPMVLEEEP